MPTGGLDSMEHALVVILCLIAPVFSYLALQRIRRNRPRKERVYLILYGAYALVLAYVLQDGRTASFDVPGWLWIPAGGLTLYTLLFMGLDLYGLLRSPAFREKVGAVYREKGFIFPTTRMQIVMFYGAAVIVGVAEEVFYRSFLPQYLHGLGMPMWAAVALMLLVFGLGHFPQGPGAVISSAVNGIMYWMLYALTGSLLAPILLHILYDARIAWTSQVLMEREAVS